MKKAMIPEPWDIYNIRIELDTYLNSFLNVESIYRTLRKFEIKGTPGDADNCPISRLLMDRFPGYRFSVSGNAIGWGPLIDSDSGWYWITVIPSVIKNFIIEFDAGTMAEMTEFYEK